MTHPELMAHVPDLVTQLTPDAGRPCSVWIHHDGVTRRCAFPARWQVTGRPGPQCGVHAVWALRRLLVEQEASGS